ncbi:MAG: sigma-70 family RNA polymerase sigma factor [Bacteroidetes bacterium]|nr:sigma-70 family RNA polymerase sigma factor [Bacteroidota bacterium]
MTSQDFLNKYEMINDLLFGFAMKLTRNKEEAKDLQQETICRAYKHRDRFANGTNFKAWLTTIMRNTFINNYRKKKTRNRVEKPVDDFLYAIENKAVKNEAERTIMGEEIEKIVANLKETYRKPFLMFFMGYQYNEIAQHMELPIGTVKSRIFFARKKLVGAIRAKYGQDFRRA